MRRDEAVAAAFRVPHHEEPSTDGLPDQALVAALAEMKLEPRQIATTSPCSAGCIVGGDVRGWIGVIAQRRKLHISEHEAYKRAWTMIAAVNPFAATLGRICPHPCESQCTRSSKEGALAINALERFLGDWALRHHLALPILDRRSQPDSVGVIGAGPAGLSFAYQMARRGYRVTVYEKQEHPGGMLRHAVPLFRLPAKVVDAEVRRILDVGVELRLSAAIGGNVSVEELRARHSVLFVAVGACRATRLDVPGERADGVWLGIDYLSAVKRGERIALGSHVIVVGGGNTAVDAARVARRTGANVTILYRRTSTEMPAHAAEVEAALAEGVTVEYRSSPLGIECRGNVVSGVLAERTRPAEADASGRCDFVPLAHTEFELPATAVIAAVSQDTDWNGIEDFAPFARRNVDALQGIESHGLYIAAGGDVLKPGLAGAAIAHGRRAAEALHARLRGLRHSNGRARSGTTPRPMVQLDCYPAKDRNRAATRAVKERLLHPYVEAKQTFSERAFLDEATRCLSCGTCCDCERCFMYCSAAAFRRIEKNTAGAYFALDTERCEQCGKCVELCPSGFLSFAPRPPRHHHA